MKEDISFIRQKAKQGKATVKESELNAEPIKAGHLSACRGVLVMAMGDGKNKMRLRAFT